MSLKGTAMTDKVLRGKIKDIHQIEEVEALYAEAEKVIETAAEARTAAENANKATEEIRNAAENGEFNGKDGKGADYNLVANALEGYASGEVVKLTDVSPLEHELSVKLTSETVSDFSSVVLQNRCACGKNHLDLELLASANNWIIDGARYCAFPIYLKPNTTYTFSRKDASSFSGAYAYFSMDTREEKATSVWFLYNDYQPLNKKVVSFTTGTTGIVYLNLMYVELGTTAISQLVELIGNAQIEEGEIATGYEPFEPAEYTPNADGTVDGVMSTYPTTTLTTDTSGVIILAEYNRDINKAFAALQNAISLNSSGN